MGVQGEHDGLILVRAIVGLGIVLNASFAPSWVVIICKVMKIHVLFTLVKEGAIIVSSSWPNSI